jgi:hypothetical protein
MYGIVVQVSMICEGNLYCETLRKAKIDKWKIIFPRTLDLKVTEPTNVKLIVVAM